MADKIAETDNQSNLPSLKSGSTEDVQAAREDLEALQAELQDALAQTPPGAAGCDDPENSQLNQMLQEVNDALEGVYRAQGLQHIHTTDSTKVGKRQASPTEQDGPACKRARSARSPTRLAAPDFLALAARHECLRPYVTECEGKGAIDFRDWNAVHALARAHLHEDFGVCGWSVPAGHLVPAIPNRLSYILWIEDLLQLSNRGADHIRALDIGCGSNLIYPLLGASRFGWEFTAADSDPCAVANACSILEQNHALKKLITTRLCRQHNLTGASEDGQDMAKRTADVDSSVSVASLYHGGTSQCHDGTQPGGALLHAMRDGEVYDFCMCNPPFFTTMGHSKQNARTDFGGTRAEMACDGGEEKFTMGIVDDSLRLKGRVYWYTTMFGKKATFRAVRKYVKSLSAISAVRSLEIAPSQTARWLLAWSFQVPKELATKPLQGLATLKQHLPP